MSELLLDRAGRRRSPATMPGFHAGRPPHNKGLRYPADPPKVEEIIAVMRAAGDRLHGDLRRSVCLRHLVHRVEGVGDPDPADEVAAQSGVPVTACAAEPTDVFMLI